MPNSVGAKCKFGSSLQSNPLKVLLTGSNTGCLSHRHCKAEVVCDRICNGPGWSKSGLNDDYTHPFTHTRLTALFPGLPRWAGTRIVKPIWILLKQETVSGSGISWAICKLAPCSRQTTTSAPHHSSFLQAGCPSCRPTNSVKALKEYSTSVWQRQGPYHIPCYA